MIGIFFRWWAAQLLDLLPQRLLRPDPARAAALLAEPEPADADGIARVRLFRRRGASELPLGTFPLGPDADATDADGAMLARALVQQDGEGGREPVLLRLPAEAALRREAFLPLAAEAGLGQVLEFEMDRLTPFPAADTFFTWSVLRRDREAGRLRLRLSVVLRQPLLPVLDALRRAGRPATAIEIVPGPQPEREPGATIPLGREHGGAGTGRLALRAAAACCALLVLATVALPFVLQELDRDRLDRRIAALAPRVAAVQALQHRITGSTAGADLVEAERRRLGDPLEVLAAVTRLLPDDTFLTDLTLRRGQLTVSGQSAAAARLIPLIGADPHFASPAFAAPVTRIEGQNTDLFSIRTGLASGNAPGSVPGNTPGSAR